MGTLYILDPIYMDHSLILSNFSIISGTSTIMGNLCQHQNTISNIDKTIGWAVQNRILSREGAVELKGIVDARGASEREMQLTWAQMRHVSASGHYPCLYGFTRAQGERIEICISSSMASAERALTLQHEVFHAIFMQKGSLIRGLSDAQEEDLCDALSIAVTEDTGCMPEQDR